MCFHLPERVLRHYGYVQTVSRPSMTIRPLDPEEMVTTFMEFVVHVLILEKRAEPVPEDEGWKHSKGYMKWFYRVSHPLMITPTAVLEYTVPRPPYEEVLVEQQWGRHPPDPFQIIQNIIAVVDSSMEGIPDMYSNHVVARVMETIRQQYRVLEEVSAPRSRSRSPREQ